MNATPRIADGVARLRSVFLETPTAQLSVGEASRLSGLELSTCAAILAAFEDAHFLRRASNGLFVRGTYAPPNPRYAGDCAESE
jgi:hypothetical protein